MVVFSVVLRNETPIVRGYSKEKLLGPTGLFRTNSLYLAPADKQHDLLESIHTDATIKSYREHDKAVGSPPWVTDLLLGFSKTVIKPNTMLTCWSTNLAPSPQSLQEYDTALLVFSTVGRLRELSGDVDHFEVDEVQYVDENYVANGNDVTALRFLKRDQFAWEREVRGVGTTNAGGGLVSDIIARTPTHVLMPFTPEDFITSMKLTSSDKDLKKSALEYATKHSLTLRVM